jgi:hypothetical protein
MLETTLKGRHTGEEIRQIINEAGGDVEIGVAFDPTEAIKRLLALGYTAKEVA